MPGATLVSARPFYHILLKMSIGKMHKKKSAPLPAVKRSGVFSEFVSVALPTDRSVGDSLPQLGSLLCPAWIGLIGSTLQKPLGTRAGKCDLVLRTVVVEHELSFRVGNGKLFHTQSPQTFHH